MNQEIFEKVKPIIADCLNVQVSDITPDKTLKDLHADSLDSVDTIMKIETEFDLAIPDDEMEKFTNIQSIVDFIEANTQAPSAL